MTDLTLARRRPDPATQSRMSLLALTASIATGRRFSPTIGAAFTAGYWFLRARCPAWRTTGDVDLRTLDRHRSAAVTALTPRYRADLPAERAVRRACLPVEIERVAEEYHVERSGNRWVSGLERMLQALV